jgi:hypothetical protein
VGHVEVNNETAARFEIGVGRGSVEFLGGETGDRDVQRGRPNDLDVQNLAGIWIPKLDPPAVGS